MQRRLVKEALNREKEKDVKDVDDDHYNDDEYEEDDSTLDWPGRVPCPSTCLESPQASDCSPEQEQINTM